jgi:hypothetical protein
MLNDINSSGLNGGPIVFVDSAAASPLTDDAIDVIDVVSRLDVPFEDVPKSAALRSDAEQQRANRFTFNRDRHQFIVAHGCLRWLLAANREWLEAAIVETRGMALQKLPCEFCRWIRAVHHEDCRGITNCPIR